MHPWSFQGRVDADNESDENVGAGADAPSRKAQAAVQVLSLSRADMGSGAFDKELHQAVVVCDMREFHDPAAGELRRHNGRHHAIIRRLAAHRAYRGWCAEMGTGPDRGGN